MTKLIPLVCSILYTLNVLAQDDNILRDRKFWAKNPNLETIKQTVNAGHSPTQLTSSGFDAVTSSIFAKANIDIVKYLLSFKENKPNKLTHDGRTYLFWAAYSGNLELVNYLLNHGARVDIIDDKGNSPLIFTAAAGETNTKIYDALISKGANVKYETNKNGANALLLLIPKLSDFEIVEYFESKGISLKSKDNYGNGVFNYTAQTGNIKMLKKLVAKGIAYNTVNTEGGNAFIFASQGSRRHSNGIDVYNYLESLGINPNITTTEGKNPLINVASNTKDTGIIDYFIKKGLNPNAADKDGNTPFLKAAQSNNLEILQYLFKLTKDINLVNNDGQSALTLAVQYNKLEIVNYLLAQKANAQIVDNKGNNLAYYLVNAYVPRDKANFYKKGKLLTDNNVDFSAIQSGNNTLYQIAIEKLDLELLKFLEPLKIDINVINNDGLSVLHLAAMKSKDDSILKYLLEQGANKKALTEFDESVYDLAQENELIKANAINITFLK
ncbi:ankyrin repeat domain-containing protein [Algibacter pectinivorans]|uniref:Ankyrin repeat-containing protein n=1 Tax=Algibacter pectinivorans TaxID=870482 RepID=A0A1I1QQX9_9FLAO|nr:ankyrin repeat domain-containing protein [Algibacter pectinivorans]SFD24526.1 Ankyrin repeat-containing protein [Algibacter pectinivorans]